MDMFATVIQLPGKKAMIACMQQ